MHWQNWGLTMERQLQLNPIFRFEPTTFVKLHCIQRNDSVFHLTGYPGRWISNIPTSPMQNVGNYNCPSTSSKAKQATLLFRFLLWQDDILEFDFYSLPALHSLIAATKPGFSNGGRRRVCWLCRVGLVGHDYLKPLLKLQLPTMHCQKSGLYIGTSAVNQYQLWFQLKFFNWAFVGNLYFIFSI